MVAFLENFPFPFNTCVGQELWRTLVSNRLFTNYICRLQTIFS
jgi:hypothetical protein